MYTHSYITVFHMYTSQPACWFSSYPYIAANLGFICRILNCFVGYVNIKGKDEPVWLESDLQPDSMIQRTGVTAWAKVLALFDMHWTENHQWEQIDANLKNIYICNIQCGQIKERILKNKSVTS